MKTRGCPVPRAGRDPSAKREAVIVDLVASHTAHIKKALLGGSEGTRADAVARSLFCGLVLKDLAKWDGKKPTTNADAFRPFLLNFLGAKPAEAVAAKYKTFRELHEALGHDKIEDLLMTTATRQRVGPACAAKLTTALTSEDPKAKLKE